ncbi:hypothetical protein QMG83_08620 [Salinibacterium sp. G-O1]|uniref:hypothetical protein n=1 Tax=Salinibacterium sp. G-O1 TaxID=3046208 RepID=UPI0024B96736|nr:hypothetical protein [Salinibacterium sp. G-O1]MDJ0335285.1 hypothetical protein [Salinibacterium sp. G-O1]
MSQFPAAQSFVTPGAILTALLGFVVGAASMAFNPFFALSVAAIALCLAALRSATQVEHHVVQGMLRVFAIIGIMGALGGVVVLLFPGLGVRT